MDSTESVTVYNFSTFDLSVKSMRVAHGKAPRELIVARFGGEVLEGTAELVSAADLDAQGLYRRVATGWRAKGVLTALSKAWVRPEDWDAAV